MEETPWTDSVNINEALGYLRDNRWKNYQRAFELQKKKVLENLEGISLVNWCMDANNGERDLDIEEALLKQGRNHLGTYALVHYMEFVMQAPWKEVVPILIEKDDINSITNFMYVWVRLSHTRAPEELEHLLCDKKHRIWWNGYAHKVCEEGLISEDELSVWMIRQG